MTGFEELEEEYDKTVADVFTDVFLRVFRNSFPLVFNQILKVSRQGVINSIENNSLVGLDMDISGINDV
jgi:hypothetical protein